MNQFDILIPTYNSVGVLEQGEKMNCPICEEAAKLPSDDILHIETDEIKQGTRKCQECGKNVCDKHSLVKTKNPDTFVCLNCI